MPFRPNDRCYPGREYHPVTEVSPHQASLEEAYMALTSDAVDLRDV
jgi:hypothetical protein